MNLENINIAVIGSKQILNHPTNHSASTVYGPIANNDVFKKQWYRACVSTHMSCHAMAKKSANDHLKFSITHINFIKSTYFKTISTTTELQLD